MTRSPERRGGAIRGACVVLALLGSAHPARGAEEGRFDVQGFRPSGAPQDLVMVQQSRPLSRWSYVVGAYFSYSLDPLKLIRAETGDDALSVVSNRVELDVMAAVGLFDIVEVNAVMPLILAQTSDNLSAVGTEGSVQGQALGDLRLTTKWTIPQLRRKPEASGFGMALTLGVTLPTGNLDAFASDGTVNYQAGLVLDYRFKSGLLLALNGGVWTRPTREWSGILVGDVFPLGLGLEIPVVRRWGLTVIGNAYTNVSLQTLRDQPRQAPLSGLVGIRWYSSYGVTLTFGIGGGCDCNFGNPAVSGFFSAIWVPGTTREKEALEHFKQPPPPDPDPDKDDVINEKDRCPEKPGPVENHGCPDTDKDGDGLVDRLDRCPTESGPGDPEGCPEFRIVEDRIQMREQVYFYTDSDLIKPESLPLLERLTRFLVSKPEIKEVRVDGHTDVRASADYNQKLSEKRARAVVKFLTGHGVHADRLQARGYGASKPLVKVEHPEQCQGIDPEDRKSRNQALPTMSDECIQASAVNRRIEFIIRHDYDPHVLPTAGLPSSSPLPGAGLPKAGLPGAGLPAAGLPGSALPEAGLPKAGLPRKMLPAPPPTTPAAPAPTPPAKAPPQPR